MLKAINENHVMQYIIFVAYLVALVSLFVCIINIAIINNTNSSIYSIEECSSIIDEYDCILVLGCGIKEDGTPTPRLNDRLNASLEAYNSGLSKLILVSGDSENPDYCETISMKNFLIANGVDETKIISDGYGLSTYESIWRAKNLYGFEKILIVTQKYHLYRSLYIADKMGMEAIGISADIQQYSSQFKYDIREALARFKDMIFAEMLPLPNYTDIWEGSYE